MLASRRGTFLGCPIDLLTIDETVNIAENAMRHRAPTLNAGVNVAKLINMRRDLRQDLCSSDVISIDGMG